MVNKTHSIDKELYDQILHLTFKHMQSIIERFDKPNPNQNDLNQLQEYCELFDEYC